MPVNKRNAIKPYLNWLLERVRDEPTISTRALARELQALGCDVQYTSVWRALAKSGVKLTQSRPRPHATKVFPYAEWVLERVRLDPQISGKSLARSLQEQNICISSRSILRFLEHERSRESCDRRKRTTRRSSTAASSEVGTPSSRFQKPGA
jgi:transposase